MMLFIDKIKPVIIGWYGDNSQYQVVGPLTNKTLIENIKMQVLTTMILIEEIW